MIKCQILVPSIKSCEFKGSIGLKAREYECVKRVMGISVMEVNKISGAEMFIRYFINTEQMNLTP